MNVKPLLRAVGCVLTLGLAGGASAPAHATPDNLLVVPGQHLGRVFLGDSKTAVHRRLGAPQRTFKLAGGLTSELWRSKPNKSAEAEDGEAPAHYTLEVVYKSGVVTQIEASNPVFRTSGGLATDSTPKAWLATLGKAPATKYRYSGDKSDQKYYDWASKGVALELQGDEASGYYGYINTVIVHCKGAKVVVDSGGRLIR